MTAICGGGASGPKPGVVETVIFTTASLASLLNNKGGLWATLVAPLLGVIAYQAEAKCLEDPPADPGMTGADYTALLDPTDWSAFSVAVGKLAQLAEIAIWYEVCECKTVGTPAPPTAPFQQPTGVGLQPSSGSDVPCYSWDGVLTTVWDDFTNATSPPEAYTIVPLPKPSTHQWQPTFTTGPVTVVPRQPTWNTLKWKVEVLTPYAGADVRVRTHLNGINNLFTNTRSTYGSGSDYFLPGSGGGPSSLEGSADWVGVPWNYLALYAVHHNVDQPVQVRYSFDIYCGTGPTAVSAPCSDPATLALLQQIYQLLLVVQRQHVPFATVPALSYPGLSGFGEITFSDPIVRAKVTLTTLPSHYGMAEGSPDAVFEVGRVALGTAEGYQESRPIASTPYVLQVPSDVTRIGYALSPGVVATIDTFSREP